MRHVTGRLAALLTSERPPDDDAALRAHLRSCADCREAYDRAVTLLRLGRGHPDAEAPGERDRLIARAAALARPAPVKRPRDLRPFFMAATAALAALLVFSLWPREVVGRVLVAGRGLTVDGASATKDAPLFEEAVIATGKEDAAIVLEGQHGRRGLLLRPHTRLRLVSSDDVLLLSGRLRVQVLKTKGAFRVYEGGARVEQVAPGVFVMEEKPQHTLVAVHQGSVRVVGTTGGGVGVKEGQQTELRGGVPSTPRPAEAGALVEDRGDGTLWDSILRFFRQLVDTIAKALAIE